MNLRASIYSFLIITALLLSSCATQHSEITLVKFDHSKFTLGEFEKAYSKNSGGIDNAKDDSLVQYENFLNLYTNFKMKLMDAAVRGYDKDSELQTELLDYKKKVGSTFLLEKQLVEPSLKDLYEKRKYELKCSHIMIRPDTIGEERAKNLADELLDRINKGESFEDLAAQYSDDTFSKNNGGDIYYITAGMLIPEFEDAAYDTKVGGVHAKSVKTRFGYHLIKVTEKQLRVPQIRASHILVDFMNENGEPDTTYAIATIDSVKKLLAEGKDFAEVAELYSKDTGSKRIGGDLNYFERRMMIKEFDEAAFKLNVNEMSDVVKTNYGFHIIKVTEKKPYPKFDEDKENLRKIYKQFRYNIELEIFTSDLLKKYNYSFNENTVNFLAENGDTVRISTEYWDAQWRDQIKDADLFSFGQEKITVDELFTELKSSNEFGNKFLTRDAVNEIIKKQSGEKVLELAALDLDKTNADFASLMEDYKNGIFIFKLQDEEVWGKIQMDSVKLFEHYNRTKDKYTWNDRISYQEIFVRDETLANSLYNQLQNGAQFDTLVANYAERPGMKEKFGYSDFVEVGSNQLAVKAAELNQLGDFSEPFANNGGFVIIKLVAKDAARIKTFDEAKAEVSGSFQEEESKRLENEYINYLKNIYKPKMFKNELVKAFKAD